MDSLGSFCAAIPIIEATTSACTPHLAHTRAISSFTGAQRSDGGCDFLQDPDQSRCDVTIFWRPEVFPSVLILQPAPADFSTANALNRLAHDASIALPSGDSGILFADTDGDHHLVTDAIQRGQPLAVLLPLDSNFHIRAEAALRLHRRLSGRAAGPIPRALTLTPRHRLRLTRMVRAIDGRSSGATYREIAAVLFKTSRQSASEWKTSSIRAQTIRLVHDAHDMILGGYRRLLAGR
jgi:hypothetical protein